MHYSKYLIILIMYLCYSNTNSYNILGLFPHPGVSHFHFFHPIMRGLSEAGHNITVISHFPDKNPIGNYTDLVLTGATLLTNSVNLQDLEKRRFYNPLVSFFGLHEWGEEACKKTFESTALEQVLSGSTRFDLIIMEQFNTDCFMGIAHVLQLPVIALSSCPLMPWHYDRVGNPIIPSYIPTIFMGQSENMGFFHRVGNWLTHHTLNFLYKKYTDKLATELVRQKFGADIPDVAELAKKTSLFFVNQHYSLSGAKPLSPATIELGGIHIQKLLKPLDMNIQQFLDSAEHGVVVFSWGSMVRAESLSAEKRNSILKAFKRLKQKIIWKWENETLPHQPSNVFVSKWLPQKDILCHPNVKVFMSHGGLLASSEAAYCGVPVVATPLFADQYLNAASLVQRGMGTILHFRDITETAVFNAINTVLDKKYMENAKKVSKSFKNRPKSPMETATWWVEHVIETKGAPLTKSISSEISGFVYHSLDVYTLFLVIIILLTLANAWILNKLLNRRKLAIKLKTK